MAAGLSGVAMLDDVVRTLYDYNSWANGRVLDRVAELTAEQLNAPGTAGHGSIRETFVHVINAQRGWLAFWDGTNPSFGRIAGSASGTGLRAEDLADAAALRKAWQAIDANTHAFTSKLDDGALAREYTRARPGQPTQTLPLWQMMLHVVNHGTQHRSEIAAMLTGFDHSPGALDVTAFLRERGQRTG
jgi:uncharacterized damage-inducible protein DinB